MALLPERTSRLALVAALAGIGTLHFAAPKAFDALIPERLPGSARAWTYGSGVVELVGAALLAAPRTRRLGGWWVVATFVGVFPGNVKAALDGGMEAGGVAGSAAVAWLRLPLQVPLVLWALRHARGRPLRS